MRFVTLSSGGTPHHYDVLFVGEQTSLVMRLIARLCALGYRPAVLNGPRLIQTLQAECGVTVDHFHCRPAQLPGRYRLRWLQELEWPIERGRLHGLLRRIRPAVIHLNYIRAQQALLYELPRCPPVVATVWGTDLHRDAVQGNRVQRARIRRVLEQARVITADSRELLGRARSLTPQKPAGDFRLVLWGIDVARFDISKDDPRVARWRQALMIPERTAVVLAPRRINPRYAPQRVLRAFARSRSARHSVLVYKIFGDNPRTEDKQRLILERLAGELGVAERLRFAEPCTYGDLSGLYRLADLACFLLPHDGTPTTAFELMAAGVPIVASDIPDYREMLIDGRHAWLVPPEDADQAARKIDEIIFQPQAVAAQCGFARQWVERYATMEITVRKFLAAYEQAAVGVDATPAAVVDDRRVNDL